MNAKLRLDEEIENLKMTQAIDLIEIKNQFQVVYDGLKPSNYLKNIFFELIKSPDLKKDLISNTLEFVSKLLVKHITIESTSNLLKKVIAIFLPNSNAKPNL